MAFDDWYDWAMGNHEQSPTGDQQTWKRVAEDAQEDACYEDTTCGDDFREEIGTRFDDLGPDSFDEGTFERVCRHDPDGAPAFQRQGKPVNGTIPAYLTRAVTVENAAEHIHMLVMQQGQARVSKEEIETLLSESTDPLEWRHLPDVMGQRLAVLPIPLAYPESERVFATLSPNDNQSPETDYSPQFWEELDEHVGATDDDQTHARIASERLALDPDLNKERHYLLLYYDHSSVGPCRYPTPPDAEFFSQFRPVNPNEHDYGWTCPPDNDEDDCNEDLAAPEVVHSNPPIDTDHVWIRSLGPLLPANA